MAERDNVRRKSNGAEERQPVALADGTKAKTGAAFERHQAHPHRGHQHPNHLGNVRPVLVDERGQQRYHHRGKARNERRFGRRGEPQSGCLQYKAGVQQRAREASGSQGFPGDRALPDFPVYQQQCGRRQGKADGEVQGRRNVGERRLDQYERGTPDHCVGHQRQLGLAAIHFVLSPMAAPVSPWRISSSRVSRIRLSPRSRPSGLNHSFEVCAPPPSPPPPIDTAGMPSDSGILASVEEQSRCERMPRWASTARRYCRMAEFSGSAAAGREPISLTFTATLPPVARWFSISRARSAAPVRMSTRSSNFWLSSERMSTLARASWAMALTPEPPSISPTFTDDLAPLSRRVSENSVTARHKACTGFPTPKSLQLWPPGPVKATSKRRLPKARVVIWSVLAPSTVTNARTLRPSGDCLHRCRMPSRLPSPSSPTLATSRRPADAFWLNPGTGGCAAFFHARATASRAARPAPLSETPGPRKRPSGSTPISSLHRGASTVSRCAVRAT